LICLSTDRPKSSVGGLLQLLDGIEIPVIKSGGNCFLLIALNFLIFLYNLSH
jgi:hypothetical protein